MNFDDLIDTLMQVYTQGSFEQEVAEAKKEFSKEAGLLDEESPEFEMRMAQFIDWYIFRRILKQSQKTPLQLALRDQQIGRAHV